MMLLEEMNGLVLTIKGIKWVVSLVEGSGLAYDIDVPGRMIRLYMKPWITDVDYYKSTLRMAVLNIEYDEAEDRGGDQLKWVTNHMTEILDAFEQVSNLQ